MKSAKDFVSLFTMDINEQNLIDSSLARLEIKELNPMQKALLEQSQNEGDVILLSPTGSGKTIAFLLPLLLSLDAELKNQTQALILVPSRELALQISEVFKKMTSDFRSYCCYGGHSVLEEKRSLEGMPPTVIVGTPGRVEDHLRNRNFSSRYVKTLVIDEFDKSLEFGFQDEMSEIIAQLPNLNKRILTSATDAAEIPEFTGLDNTTKLDFLPTEAEKENTVSRLTLCKVISPARDKIDTLYNLLCSLGSNSSIVFCNHRDAVDRVNLLLEERGLPTARFHGGMEQDDRERALYKYRNGSAHVLVSTDLAARGLDISEVQHVIHYHLPPHQDAFIHRNGRTARWDATGKAYIILSEEEEQPYYLEEELPELEVKKATKQPPLPKWITLYVGRGKKQKMNKMDIAGFLYKVGGLNRDELGQIDVKEHYGLVTVRRDKVKTLLKTIKGQKIKGKKVLIEEARN